MTLGTAICEASALRGLPSHALSRAFGTVTNSGHRILPGTMLHKFRAISRNVIQAGRAFGGEASGFGCPGCSRGLLNEAPSSSFQSLRDAGCERGGGLVSIRGFALWAIENGGSLGARFQKDVTPHARNEESVTAETFTQGRGAFGVDGVESKDGQNRSGGESGSPFVESSAGVTANENEDGELLGREAASDAGRSPLDETSSSESVENESGHSTPSSDHVASLIEESELRGSSEPGEIGATSESCREDDPSISAAPLESADRVSVVGPSGSEPSNGFTAEAGVGLSEPKRKPSPNSRKSRIGRSPPNPQSSSEPILITRVKQGKGGTEPKKDANIDGAKSNVFKGTGRPPKRIPSEERKRREEVKALPISNLLSVKGIGPKYVGRFIEKGIKDVEDLENLYKDRFYKKSEHMIAYLQTDIGVKQAMWAKSIVDHIEKPILAGESDTPSEDTVLEIPRKKPLTFCVEGNISVGKSTFLRQVVKETFLLKEMVDISPEPVEKWQSVGEHKHNILHSFYQDPRRYAYTFQNYVFFTRMLQAQEKLNDPRPLRLMERSVFSDRMVFVRAVHEAKYMDDMEISIYDSWFDPILAAIPTLVPDGFIYLRAKPGTCFNRLKKRGRSEETAVDLDYLQNLHEKHEDWLLNPSGGQPLRADSSSGHALIPGSKMGIFPTAIQDQAYLLRKEGVHSKIQGVPALVLDCDPDMDLEKDSETKEKYAEKVKVFYDHIEKHRLPAGADAHIIMPEFKDLEDLRRVQERYAQETDRGYAYAGAGFMG